MLFTAFVWGTNSLGVPIHLDTTIDGRFLLVREDLLMLSDRRIVMLDPLTVL